MSNITANVVITEATAAGWVITSADAEADTFTRVVLDQGRDRVTMDVMTDGNVFYFGRGWNTCIGYDSALAAIEYRKEHSK